MAKIFHLTHYAEDFEVNLASAKILNLFGNFLASGRILIVVKC